MSLNWREIDTVLAELSLVGATVQNIVQVDFHSLHIEFYQPGRNSWLFVSLQPGFTRLHLSIPPPRTKGISPRFCKFLQSNIHQLRVRDYAQFGRERIVVMNLEDMKSGTVTRIFIRLWGNAANIVVTSPDNIILDAFFRRPHKNEMSGKQWILPAENLDRNQKAEGFVTRAWQGSPSFNHFLETEYQKTETEHNYSTLKLGIERSSLALLSRIESRLGKVRKQLQQGAGFEQHRRTGEMILAASHSIIRGAEWLDAEDWENPGHFLQIQLDARLSPSQNAERYFQRFRKARDGESHLRLDLRSTEAAFAEVSRLHGALTLVTEMSELKSIAQELEPFQDVPRSKQGDSDTERPGLSCISHGFLLLIGRSAQENDVLLRRFVRGNDYWLHVRDLSGAYVFIKVPRNKSVPLEVLLDASHLAVWYSRAKGNPEVDLFYTQVKYLRRAKHGTFGMVIPTREKNIHVSMDGARIENLQRALKV